MRIEPVPLLTDNYAYLLIDDSSSRAAVVDPSEPGPVLDRLRGEGLEIAEIWITHHHWDHVGGVEELCRVAPGAPVLGGTYDEKHGRIPNQSRGLRDGETFEIFGREVTVLEIPGHTLGAIAYLVDGNLFTGDTLFIAGCGRIFEGTMEMMKDSLAKLRALPEKTRFFCGHEYTVRNLEYAQRVEPENDRIAEALGEARKLREAGAATVPGMLERELATNPFLRFDVAEVAQGRTAVESFTALREAKDRF